jgi:hypothetical protein
MGDMKARSLVLVTVLVAVLVGAAMGESEFLKKFKRD